MAAQIVARSSQLEVGVDFDQPPLGARRACSSRAACRCFPSEKICNLAEVARLRKQATPRISWAAIFVKAYALAAQCHPPLRRTYIRWPWPHLVEESHSTAMVVVNRQYLGEDRICWGRLPRPESRPLVQLQRQLDAYQNEPVEKIFRRQITLSRMPTPLRRLLYWWNQNFGGRKASQAIGHVHDEHAGRPGRVEPHASDFSDDQSDLRAGGRRRQSLW